ncbi:hypothetical protein CSUI_001249 [Cystoisospora suis]|uniref:Uncharacterized protein n=1 Tax=Cystoisospora suis TaxID=483139 RepID=A0A2C6L9E3_9APIC|nr:hypothetical protein CSUI_001249 [Cystoisospora suis]
MQRQWTKLGDRKVPSQKAQRPSGLCPRGLPEHQGTARGNKSRSESAGKTHICPRPSGTSGRPAGAGVVRGKIISDRGAVLSEKRRNYSSPTATGGENFIPEALEASDRVRELRYECPKGFTCSNLTVGSLLAEWEAVGQASRLKTGEGTAHPSTSSPANVCASGVPVDHDIAGGQEFGAGQRSAKKKSRSRRNAGARVRPSCCRDMASRRFSPSLRSCPTVQEDTCPADNHHDASCLRESNTARKIQDCAGARSSDSREDFSELSSTESTSEASGVSWIDFSGLRRPDHGAAFLEGHRSLPGYGVASSAGRTKGRVYLSQCAGPAVLTSGLEPERVGGAGNVDRQDARRTVPNGRRGSNVDSVSIRCRAGRWLRRISTKPGMTDLTCWGSSGHSEGFPSERGSKIPTSRGSLSLLRKGVVYSLKKTLQHGSRITRSRYHGSAGEGEPPAAAGDSAATFLPRGTYAVRECLKNGRSARVPDTPFWRSSGLGSGDASSRRGTSLSSSHRWTAFSDELDSGGTTSSAEDFLEVNDSDTSSSSNEELPHFPLQTDAETECVGYASAGLARAEQGLVRPAASACCKSSFVRPDHDRLPDTGGGRDFSLSGSKSSDRETHRVPGRRLSAQSTSASVVQENRADSLVTEPGSLTGEVLNTAESRCQVTKEFGQLLRPTPGNPSSIASSPLFPTLAHVNASIDWIVEVGMDPHMIKKARDRFQKCPNEAAFSFTKGCDDPHPVLFNEATQDDAEGADVPTVACQPSMTAVQRVKAMEPSEWRSTGTRTRWATHISARRGVGADFPLLDDSCENMLTIQLAEYEAEHAKQECHRSDRVVYVQRSKEVTNKTAGCFSYASTEYRIGLDSVI